MKDKIMALIKENAHAAYYRASDQNRCDRWSDEFDDDIRVEFEAHFAEVSPQIEQEVIAALQSGETN